MMTWMYVLYMVPANKNTVIVPNTHYWHIMSFFHQVSENGHEESPLLCKKPVRVVNNLLSVSLGQILNDCFLLRKHFIIAFLYVMCTHQNPINVWCMFSVCELHLSVSLSMSSWSVFTLKIEGYANKIGWLITWLIHEYLLELLSFFLPYGKNKLSGY